MNLDFILRVMRNHFLQGNDIKFGFLKGHPGCMAWKALGSGCMEPSQKAVAAIQVQSDSGRGAAWGGRDVKDVGLNVGAEALAITPSFLS